MSDYSVILVGKEEIPEKSGGIGDTETTIEDRVASAASPIMDNRMLIRISDATYRSWESVYHPISVIVDNDRYRAFVRSKNSCEPQAATFPLSINTTQLASRMMQGS